MQRITRLLPNNWYYRPGFTPGEETDPAVEGFVRVGLPHTVTPVPDHYLAARSFQGLHCYKRALALDPAWRGHRIFLDFAGVMTAARVFCNGRPAGQHRGGFTPFSVELTDLLRWDGTDGITVAVDSTERPDTPPFGHVVDYLCYGGIYREVTLRAVPPAHITALKAEPGAVLEPSQTLTLRAELTGVPAGAVLTARLQGAEGPAAQVRTSLDAGQQTAVLNFTGLTVRRWELDDPALYTLTVTLEAGPDTDETALRVGFRQAEFTPRGFFLNGRPCKLRGLNRHQQYPVQGYAMPWRAQYRDADILKRELHLNMVRTSHYPQSPHFLDRCDEIGLLVFEELPGWQHIGDEAWQDQSCRDLEAMIRRDWNHPSIVLWGVRVNESQDNHDFYTRTNALAHRLDPTRPTGGVRYLEHSELLEDVYTFNDFVHDGTNEPLRDPRAVTGLDRDVPYLVSEHTGHMYPTKRFDCEERLDEQALRHLRVLNAAAADDRISGAIGWCAFDYGTHRDFGSGDEVCYHGVMDMYRLPKFAAAAYRSQTDEEVVLEPLTRWTRGDRSGGSKVLLVLCTNCDAVRVELDGQDRGTYFPDREHFPALAHPPIILPKLSGGWGDAWYDAVFVGLQKGQAVIRRRYAAEPLPTALELLPDDTRLQAGPAWDTTRVVCRLVDDCGHPLAYDFTPVQLAAHGVGEILGATLVSLLGGEIAFWVRTDGRPGTVQLTARTAQGLTASATLTVE